MVSVVSAMCDMRYLYIYIIDGTISIQWQLNVPFLSSGNKSAILSNPFFFFFFEGLYFQENFI